MRRIVAIDEERRQLCVLREHPCPASGVCPLHPYLSAAQDRCRDLLRRKRRSAPLPLILGKKGECRRPDGTGVAGCVLDAARSAHMCSEVFHNNSFTDTYTGFPE